MFNSYNNINNNKSWVDLGVGNMYHITQFNDQTEEQEEFIAVYANKTDELVETTELDQQEISKLVRNLEEKLIIQFRFNPENYYERQNGKIQFVTQIQNNQIKDTIVICREKVTSFEFAISFTDSQQTNEFWEYIKKNNGVNINEGSSYNDRNYGNIEPEMPSHQSLQEILQSFDSDFDFYVTAIMNKPEYINKLFEIFEELEDLEDYEKLNLIYQIVRKIQIIFYNCLGALECIYNKLKPIIFRNNIDILEYIKQNEFIKEFSDKFFNNLNDSIQFTSEIIKKYEKELIEKRILDREKFRDSIGILGLDYVQFSSDRIFNVIAGQTGIITFSKFLQYYDIIINGEESEQIKISFKLIDVQQKGFFIKEDLSSMINSIVRSWAALTQTQLNQKKFNIQQIIYLMLWI
ncbi:phosphatidylinositol-4-phosphate 5-kinase family protein, putative [Ichthyophthirius multifiliis]|uniref:Phosphatidylinositol-4-phosphate 5-kinase family protein, putative n=1 Tax=Ichthyophthirius multifiliis TaxID=5932 RepID=G0QLM5_ICHMU|nr:phosphatidylinositol-4-phosphate 5-kinase family protein, putative [Ichthyophthirius multifiliis]EGR33881.1 phosphatidylinositol-4-phosphate 5-kinase family protein, putative [Ichthyophthirius multifiliis]|eukprot:XP_004039105.1 phosphatidylinositol-4-phosphate 5-kinase family protein, putative [Ichthyophthirius multifiliis]